MSGLKRVGTLCLKTGERIKNGWLCGAEILSGGTSGTHSRTKRAFHSKSKKPEDERNKKRARGAAASDGVYGNETGRLI